MWQDRAFSKLLALLHKVTLKHNAVFTDRYEVLFFLTRFFVGKNEGAFASHDGTEVHHAINLGDLSGILRLASFKQLGHTRQTTGNILGLGGFPRGLG